MKLTTVVILSGLVGGMLALPLMVIKPAFSGKKCWHNVTTPVHSGSGKTTRAQCGMSASGSDPECQWQNATAECGCKTYLRRVACKGGKLTNYFWKPSAALDQSSVYLAGGTMMSPGAAPVGTATFHATVAKDTACQTSLLGAWTTQLSCKDVADGGDPETISWTNSSCTTVSSKVAATAMIVSLMHCLGHTSSYHKSFCPQYGCSSAGCQTDIGTCQGTPTIDPMTRQVITPPDYTKGPCTWTASAPAGTNKCACAATHMLKNVSGTSTCVSKPTKAPTPKPTPTPTPIKPTKAPTPVKTLAQAMATITGLSAEFHQGKYSAAGCSASSLISTVKIVGGTKKCTADTKFNGTDWVPSLSDGKKQFQTFKFSCDNKGAKAGTHMYAYGSWKDNKCSGTAYQVRSGEHALQAPCTKKAIAQKPGEKAGEPYWEKSWLVCGQKKSTTAAPAAAAPAQKKSTTITQKVTLRGFTVKTFNAKAQTSLKTSLAALYGVAIIDLSITDIKAYVPTGKTTAAPAKNSSRRQLAPSAAGVTFKVVVKATPAAAAALKTKIAGVKPAALTTQVNKDLKAAGIAVKVTVTVEVPTVADSVSIIKSAAGTTSISALAAGVSVLVTASLRGWC